MMKNVRFFKRLGWVCVVLLLCPVGIFGASSGKKIEHLKKEAENITRKIREGNADIQKFAQKEKAIITSLNKADMDLNKVRKQVAASRSEMSAVEEKIRKTKAVSRELAKQIKAQEGYASQRLVALYKLNRLGKMSLLASADSVTDFFQRKTALKRILGHNQNVLQALSADKSRLQTTLEGLNAQKKKKRSLQAAYKKQVREMSQKKARRSMLLSDIRNQKSLTLASIESLKQAANQLDQKIKTLLLLKARKSEKTGKWGTGKFSSLKGLLKMPVKGKIVSFFGRYKNTEFNVTNFRSGIDIKADRGDPIHAVCSGEVLYANWFKGYGNMLIIDHGNHYCTLYAHVEELFKKQGERVEAGEVVATVGDTGSMEGPRLHFEVRHHGKSVDPMKWIKKG